MGTTITSCSGCIVRGVRELWLSCGNFILSPARASRGGVRMISISKKGLQGFNLFWLALSDMVSSFYLSIIDGLLPRIDATFVTVC